MPKPNCLAALALISLCGVGTGADSTSTFESQARPLLRAYCVECHGEGEKLKGGLDLRLRRTTLKGGESGPAIVPGHAETSLLIQRVRDGTMPPGKKKLSAAEMEILARWISQGARVDKPEPEVTSAGMLITQEDRSWWAFQPVRRTPASAVSGLVRTPIDSFILDRLTREKLTFNPEADRVAFIRRATFDLTGLPPTPAEVEAFVADGSARSHEALIDRLLARPEYGERWARHWLDVAGYADSEGATVDDPVRASAWRYRDYVIRSLNADKPFDQFIREQLAGDELVRGPVAELSPADLDKVIATGFLRMAPDATASPGGNTKEGQNQVVADTLKIVSSAFMGLTVGCAQCHNHRYDPIPQADYYRLRAVFEPALNMTAWKAPAAREVSLYTQADRDKAAAIEKEAAKIDQDRTARLKAAIEATFRKELAKLPEAVRPMAEKARETPEAKRTPEQKKLLMDNPSLNVSDGSLYLYDPKAIEELNKFSEKATALRGTKPAEGFVRPLTEPAGAKLPVTRLFHRGDPDQPKQELAPGALAILDDRHALAVPAPDPGAPGSGRRLALANWLVDPRNPLTARVLVNRVWMHHFGKGLVATPGDFGRLGLPPSHPELLDWLADEFMRSGWNLKHLHRLMLCSTTYRQSSQRDARRDAVDADNRLLSRMPARRLEAEQVRDSLLSISGTLVPRQFGPPVPVRENENGQIVPGHPNRDAAGYFSVLKPLAVGEEFRRTIYLQVRRTQPLSVAEPFDNPVTEPNCECRGTSTATPQTLVLLNDEFTLKSSEAFAKRVRAEAGPDATAQVSRAWKLVMGREPTPVERGAALAFLAEQAQLLPPVVDAAKAAPKTPPRKVPGMPTTPAPADLPVDTRALAVLGQALFCSNGFLYLD